MRESTDKQRTTAGIARERAATLAIWTAAALISGLFLWITTDIVLGGSPRLSWDFLTTPATDAGRSGGIGPIIVSTALILLVTLSASVPPALATAVLLAEFSRRNSRFARGVRLSLDVLAAVPSIVFGLFGNAFFCIALGLGFSILSGGLTLACMVLPILIRTAEQGLRAVPDEIRLAAAALGLSRSAALFHLLLPAAMPALVAGLMLGIGRAAAETAALIFTSGYVDRMPSSLFDSGRPLAVHIYDLAMNIAGGDANARASALVLMIGLLLINGTALTLGTRWRNTRIITV